MNHSVIEHRANYHYIKLEEDYIQICSQGKEYPHCKAFILSILEHWMNDKASKGQGEYVYMTYPQWRDAMYGLFRRNHIINALAELVQEGLILKRPCRVTGKDTYEYSLHVPVVQERLKALEEKAEKYTRPKINPFKFKRVEKQTGLNLNASTHPNLNASTHDDPFKFGHNIDSITEIPENRESERGGEHEQSVTTPIASGESADAALSPSPQSENAESESDSQRQEVETRPQPGTPIPPAPALSSPPDALGGTNTTASPKWDAQAMVARAEVLREKPFSEQARPKETRSARKLFARKPDLTMEEFDRAFQHWNTPWWHETNGPFCLTDLAAVPKNKSEMRLILALEKLAMPKKPPGGQVIEFSAARGSTQKWRSSFDDPDYDMTDEFYPGTVAR